MHWRSPRGPVNRPADIAPPVCPRGAPRLRALYGALALCVATQSATAWEIDFHYYVVYLLLRARGYSAADSHQLAGFSQYIDDNKDTEPIFQPAGVRAKFHFDGSAENQATPKKGVDGQKQIADAFAKFASNPATGKFDVGAALHREADTFSHAGFTAWWNSAINRRTGSWFRPDIGHADDEDSGHRPDWPHRDPPNALAAAEWLYRAIPAGGPAVVPWEELRAELKAAFDAVPSGKTESAKFRVPLIRAITTKRFTDDPNVTYDVNEFDQQSDAFEKELSLQ